MKLLFIFMVFSPTLLFGQLTRQDSVWLPFKSMLGNWVGKSEGQPGSGSYERSYQLILNKKFIEVKNKSTYPPSAQHPNGEIHQDHGYISFDKLRKAHVLRQFHVEGFVNQYRLVSISEDRKTLVFLTESIENIPAGFRARETYQLISENEFIEIFELAEPGKDFELYSKATLTRVK